VSDTDSFISEVSEEVRRDRLFSLMRRYGWIAVLAVLLLVGGAGYSEWRKSTQMAQAQARGDALLNALEMDDSGDRAAALAAVPADGSVAVVVALLAASEQERAGDPAAAAQTLMALANEADIEPLYRDLALLKAVMLQAAEMSPEARKETLAPLAQPGAPYRLLALEQIAYAELDAGDTDTAVAGLRQIVEDANVTRGLRERAIGLIVALGGELSELEAVISP